MEHAPVRAVVFDLDGTLADTAPELSDALNDACRSLGLPETGEHIVATWIGNGARELFITALAQIHKKSKEMVVAEKDFPKQVEQFQHFYQQRCGTRSTLFPGAQRLLEALKQQRFPCALLTNKETRFTRKLLDHLGITAYFDAMVCGDTLPGKKPDPQGLRYCCAQLGVLPQQTVYIGDSSIDVATARAAKSQIWACTYGYNRGQPIARERPDRLIDRLDTLLDLIPPQHPAAAKKALRFDNVPSPTGVKP